MAVDANDAGDRVRLHITPFNPELLEKIIAPSIRPLASGISFHTVQTFPERGFGYVELPEMEAQRLKKKLNGSTLKGAKVRIEGAKPEKKRRGDDEESGSERDAKARRTERMAKKREHGVLPGHELEEGRHVKRGWTDTGQEGKSSDKKKKDRRSKSQNAEENVEGKKLRFKTMIPPNVSPVETESKDKKKQKKSKDSKKDKNKVIVQEFSKTKRSSAIASGSDDTKHGQLSYEDGRGWVDENGTVVEAEPPSRRSRRRKQPETSTPDAAMDQTGPTSTKVSALASTETNDDADSGAMSLDEPSPQAKDDDHRPINAIEQEHDVEAGPSEPANEVHPLEALFKRPASKQNDIAKRKPMTIDTSFSFFDQEAAAEADDAAADSGVSMPPQTPHTKRDLEWRSIRSAAPTPDTAAIGRRFSFPFPRDVEDEEEVAADEDAEMQDAEQAGQANVPDRGEESAFRKWFYENRGDFNRGWKKRRREEKKQIRQRENRRSSRRVA